jgi:glycosyltransferase involved in cell wall biosynthesis
MKVLHVTPSYYPAVRYGGPIVSVRALCRALAAQGVEVDVATTNADGPVDLQVPTDRWTTLDGLRIRYFRRWPRLDYAFSPGLASFLRERTRDYDLVHITSTFSFPATAAGWAARRSGIPYVVSPRGSLQRWSLGQKRWKKQPYWALLERRQLQRAAAIHVTAELERQELLEVLPGAEVIVCPNGLDPVSVPAVARLPRRIVFLGRIHRKKGLDVLAKAAALLVGRFPELEVVVAGPDDTGEQARVTSVIEALEPRPRFRWLGPVEGDAKWELLASAAAFALPSHAENFGLSVVEAMACGTPVVVSRNCPWAVVEERGAGAWVENTPGALAGALERILSQPAMAEGMGRAGRLLAAEYAWPAVGRQFAAELHRLATSRSSRHGRP